MGAVRFGTFVFDAASRQLTRDAEPVHLTPKAFDLLQVLIDARPRAVTKSELRERLWPDVVVDESNLKSLVAEVRAALGDIRVIRTVHRYGYAFAAETLRRHSLSARLISGDHTHKLQGGDNLIGRDEDCTVVLDFTGVSRHHAKITISDGLVVLVDLQSKNGTWKNDQRVEGAVELHDGDQIRLGGVSLRFRLGSHPLTTATL